MEDLVKNFLINSTLLAQVIALLLLGLLIFGSKNNTLLSWVAKNALLISFLITLGALIGSLFYSEIALFTPCKLCWYQRIFMYPQTFLLGMALLRKNVDMLIYTTMLSVFGAFIAIIHYIEQMSGVEIVNCTFGNSGTSCLGTEFVGYGYITIPLMSFTIFALSILIYVAKRRATTQ